MKGTVDEDPDLALLRDALRAANGRVAEAQRTASELNAIINPAGTADPGDPWRYDVARAEWPTAERELRLARRDQQVARLAYDTRRAALREAFDRERMKQRKRLVTKMFEQLRPAQIAANEIARFDDESEARGGSRPAHPWGLLRSDVPDDHVAGRLAWNREQGFA